MERTFTTGGTDVSEESQVPMPNHIYPLSLPLTHSRSLLPTLKKYMWLKRHLVKQGADKAAVSGLMTVDRLRQWGTENGFLTVECAVDPPSEEIFAVVDTLDQDIKRVADAMDKDAVRQKGVKKVKVETPPRDTNKSKAARKPSCGYEAGSQRDQMQRYFGEVTEDLVIGSLEAANDEALQCELGITHVVDTSDRRRNLRLPNVSYLDIHIADGGWHGEEGSDIFKHFEEVNAFIRAALEEPEGRVFVHCAAGVSRSVTLMAAYLMSEYKLKRREAVGMIQQVRRKAQPNPKFIEQLDGYYAALPRG